MVSTQPQRIRPKHTQKFNQKNRNGKKFVKWNFFSDFFGRWPNSAIASYSSTTSFLPLHKSSSTSMKFVWLLAANRKIANAWHTGFCVEVGCPVFAFHSAQFDSGRKFVSSMRKLLVNFQKMHFIFDFFLSTHSILPECCDKSASKWPTITI